MENEVTKAGDKIREEALQALAFARGEDTGAIAHEPASVPDTVDVKAIRQKLQLSQAGFARQFGFTTHSIRNWEQCSRKPPLQARAFLKVIEKVPEAVREALTP
jgi:putative transcriptional regulator